MTASEARRKSRRERSSKRSTGEIVLGRMRSPNRMRGPSKLGPYDHRGQGTRRITPDQNTSSPRCPQCPPWWRGFSAAIIRKALLMRDLLDDLPRQRKADAARRVVDAALGERQIAAARAAIGVQFLDGRDALIGGEMAQIDARNRDGLRILQLRRRDF